MAIEFVPIQDATDTLIDECINAVLDTLPDDSPLPQRIWARVECIRENSYPASADLLVQSGVGVGISGWFPLWDNPYGAWSSATYISPKLRGKGLLPVLRCRQIHSAAQILRELDAKVEFVSSIDPMNHRSIRASFKYAKSNRWPNEWYLYDDKENDRIMLRMVWPNPLRALHDCFLGKEMTQFEEPISKPEIELLDEELVNQELEITITDELLDRHGLN